MNRSTAAKRNSFAEREVEASHNFLLQVDGKRRHRVCDAEIFAAVLDRPRAHALRGPLFLHILCKNQEKTYMYNDSINITGDNFL